MAETPNETDETPPSTGLVLPSKWYDVLKPVVTIVLPAFATFYLTLSGIWGLPAADKVTATTTAVTTLLGVLMGISTRNYNKSELKYDGSIEVSLDDTGKKTFALVLNGDPYQLDEKTELVFKMEPSKELQ